MITGCCLGGGSGGFLILWDSWWILSAVGRGPWIWSCFLGGIGGCEDGCCGGGGGSIKNC